MIMEEKKSTRKWISVGTGLAVGMVTIAVAFGAEKLTRTQKADPVKVIVDKEVQKIADDVLVRAMKRTHSTSGFVIVTDPSTGKILAVANMDIKDGRKGHWALSQPMEPATFAKTIVVAQAIENKKTTSDENQTCENGTYKFNDSVYHDWKKEGWSKLTTEQTLALSSDICSIKIGEKVGAEELEHMLQNFGFDNIPENGPQFIPQVTAGFGFKASPAELLQAYGAIANGGNLMDAESSKVIRRVLSEDSATKMREMLQQVVVSGTGKNAISDLYTTAGKTASARLNEFKKIDWYGGKTLANFAGFIGFAPVKNPKVQVFIGLINADTDKTGAHGSTHAAPAFKEVVENVLTHLKVAPDKI